MKIDTLTATEQLLIERFIALVTDETDVISIYLFGSRARGSGNTESDIDLALVVRDVQDLKEMTGKVIDISINAEEETRVNGELILSPVVINEASLNADVGIGKSIRTEGILLWQKKSTSRREKAI